MNLGKAFKASSVSFKKNIAKILMFSLSWSILLSAIYILFDLYLGIGLVLSLFFVLPSLSSIQIIAMKCVADSYIESKDFYIGFKAYGPSLYLQLRTFIKGSLFALLGFFAGLFICSFLITFKAMAEFPEYFVNIDPSTFYQSLGSIPWMSTYLNYASYVSFFIALVFFVLFGTKNNFSPFICYTTQLNANYAVELSKSYVSAHKGYFYKVGFSLLGILIPLLAFPIALNQVLALTSLGSIVSYIISFFIATFLIALYLFYYFIFYFQVYHHYFEFSTLIAVKKLQEKMSQRAASFAPKDDTTNEEDKSSDSKE